MSAWRDHVRHPSGRLSADRPPTISVVIKSYNHVYYVAQSIQSILDQSFADFELIITDDGSRDGTPEIIRQFSDPRIDFEALPENRGLSYAMNACLARASGEFIAILNSDDLAHPERLERQLAYLRATPQAAAVFNVPRIMSEDGDDHPGLTVFAEPLAFPDFTLSTWLRQFFLRGNCLCAPAAMVRRSAYLAAGPYDRRLTNLQDLDMWIRLLKSGELHVLPDRLISFRVRDNNANLSAPRVDSQLRSNFEYAQVLKRVLDFGEAQIRQAFAPELASLAQSQTMSKAQLAAEIALQAGGVPHRLFALQTLYAAARSDADFQRLKEVTGSTNVFNLPVDPTLRF